MRFHPHATIYYLAHTFYLSVGNNRGMPHRSHNSKYAGCAQDLELALKAAADKHVTREQRQTELLRSILPTVRRVIKRKKHLVPFVHEHGSNRFLVLVARVQRVPRRQSAVSLRLHPIF